MVVLDIHDDQFQSEFWESVRGVAAMCLQLKVTTGEGRMYDEWSIRHGACVTFIAEWGYTELLRRRLEASPPAVPQEWAELFDEIGRQDGWEAPYSRGSWELLQQVKTEWEELLECGQVSDELVDEQFNTTLLAGLTRAARLPEDLQLDWWGAAELVFEDRDVAECFVIGLACSGRDASAHREAVSDADSGLRTYLSGQVTQLRAAHPDLDVAELVNIEWLPPGFWWRHYPWDE